MSMSTKLLFLAVFVCVMILMSFNYAKKKKKVVFFGDSITQAAVQPNGFITKIGEYLKRDNEEENYELIGAGVSGNKVYDLYLRMDEDVLGKGPDVVVIYVGVNDVWHKKSSGTGTDADKFLKFYEAIIRKIQAAGSKIILCTPAAIGEKTDHTNELDGDLNKYSQMIRDLATKHSLLLVDLRKIFLAYNLTHNAENKEQGILTTDKVHLNPLGNQVVAEEMWKVIQQVK